MKPRAMLTLPHRACRVQHSRFCRFTLLHPGFWHEATRWQAMMQVPGSACLEGLQQQAMIGGLAPVPWRCHTGSGRSRSRSPRP